LREQIFQVDDTDNYQVAFPWYIHKIRAIRMYNTMGGVISLEDMRPRYHTNRWGTQRRLKYIIKQTNAALSKNITNVGPLTFTLPLDEVASAELKITIIGKTIKASRTAEQLTLAVGENSVTGSLHFEEVESIEKNNLNDFDITITAIDGEELGMIPNAELRSNYTIVKIREDDYALAFNNSYPVNTIELLYKTKFVPFRNTYDEYPCPDCDPLIAWKFRELYWGDKPGHSEEALLAHGKAAGLLKQLSENDNVGKDMEPNVKTNRMFDAQELPSISDVSRFIQDPPQISYPE
jgi:hypothetical protein